jgi:PPK2 family polyphosphate:nucleotide phosphotransferase
MPTSNKQEGATAAKKIGHASQVTSPEKEVEHDSRSDPDYPSYRVEPGKKFKLSSVDPAASEEYTERSGLRELDRQRERLSDLQDILYAEEKMGLLVILQAIGSGGKDGVSRGVFRGINPQGCNIWHFKEPSDEEKSHDFLWRYHPKVPEKGTISIFNRSYYEQVLSDRVKGVAPEEVWRARYDQINQFERILTLNNTTIVKFYLHLSREENKRRLEERLTDPNKHYLFSEADIEEREAWDDYMAAFEDMVNECSTEYAPWYVIPTDNKWYRNLVIARTLADTLEALGPQYPPLQVDPRKVKIPD